MQPSTDPEFSGAGLDQLGNAVEKLAENGRVHRRLSGIGLLHIERRLPFLCVYRRPARPDLGTAKLVSCLPSHLLVEQNTTPQTLSDALERLGACLAEGSGELLLLEVCSASHRPHSELLPARPSFRVLAGSDPRLDATLGELQAALAGIEIDGSPAEVQIERSTAPSAALPALLLPEATPIQYVALEIEPVYRDADDHRVFPIVLAKLRSQLYAALKRSVFAFESQASAVHSAHPDRFGSGTLSPAAREADRQLTLVSDSLRYLFFVTPTNTERAFLEFSSSGCAKEPEFVYRPLDFDPLAMKREIYGVQLDRVEDPTLHAIFREKQDELDRLLTLLLDRGSERFVWGSLQVFGGVGEGLLSLAREMLEHQKEEPDFEQVAVEPITAESFAELARREIEHYRASWPEIAPEIVVRADIPGVMVLNGNLVVGRGLNLAPGRAHALLQHEVGTHLVTYFNGSAQRLRHLSSGFAGYEALQEGLGVVAEYLSSGLTAARLKLLAARVLAVASLLDGASFIDTYRMSTEEMGLSARSAFSLTMRVHRGGGLTKDAIYLRGLGQVLEYLAGGGNLAELMVGKFGARHVPLVRELRARGIVQPPRLLPRYLADRRASERLSALAKGSSVLDLLKETPCA